METIKTDKTIPNNKPHNINLTNENEKCLLIDTSGNIKKEAKKILK
jgi:hypothetical protein